MRQSINRATHTPSGQASKPLYPPAPRPQKAPLGPFTMLRLLRRNPIETWTEAHFQLPILIGPTILGQVAVLNDPAAIRRVFVDNASNYHKDRLQKRILGPGLGQSVLIAEDADWRLQRRILAPLFTPKTVATFAKATQECASEMVARWQRLPEESPLDIHQEMTKITLEILGRTLFADGLDRRPEEVTAAMTRYFETIGSLDPFDLLDLPNWLPRWNQWRAKSALDFLGDTVSALISRRKRLLARGVPNLQRDLLTLLLEAEDPETGVGLTETEVQANIVAFIGAGHETTANALTWSLYLLSLSEEWRARLAAEADRVLDMPVESQAEHLIETRAVIEEAMRLYPPVASLSREALDYDDLAGRRIRKGTVVMVSQWVLHRHRLLWEDPDRFDPTRFLPGQREKIDRFAYLPFGAGPRVCIGAGFAMQEATLVLAQILRAVRLETKKGFKAEPVQHITLRPRGGMPMILHHRLQRHGKIRH
ncbi:cytochrome P450 [Beijerinckia indica]|uniref:Cytochrome P450 n=1 Tax=Beijerinckia indica subsp. indica (strain ATCC 9039 / DSM 1715 / NCIMB 8712) TaxID=395963 RepID=B2IH70_BEII9|nr:cytochrome P450 [Beijerinckia indica]ACB94483.1 cytochrome P450 [Beijerinckia indica subsp. indica ATCC 9039]